MEEERKTQRQRTITEEIDLAGNQLVDEIKRLVAEGNVRQIRIKDADGDVYLETPLTFGAIAGGAVVLAAPWLAILGVIAALVTRIRVEIVRDAKDGEKVDGEQRNKDAA
jgi:phage terminase large subunit-like protein